MQEHKDILDCIENRDPEGSVLAMKRHLQGVLTSLED
ncbi:FCD domain-containing protein [Cytobacillus purgationiresistens]